MKWHCIQCQVGYFKEKEIGLNEMPTVFNGKWVILKKK